MILLFFKILILLLKMFHLIFLALTTMLSRMRGLIKLLDGTNAKMNFCCGKWEDTCKINNQKLSFFDIIRLLWKFF